MKRMLIQKFYDDLKRNRMIDELIKDKYKNREEALLSRTDASNFLGISLRTLDDLKASGEIPYVKVRRSIKFRKRELVKYIQKHSRRNPTFN